MIGNSRRYFPPLEREKEMSKFEVSVELVCEETMTARLRVQNRAGRTWFAKEVQDYGNAEEEAMVLNEMLAYGEKLNPEAWTAS
jgi:hypothetical protein